MSHAKQLHNRRYLDDYLTIMNRAGLPDNVKAQVCQQVQHAVIATVQWTIEQALPEELTAYLGCARYTHLPQGRRRAAKRQQKRVVLTALGVWPDGHWEILHGKIAVPENAETWDAFFGELYAKGVTEETIQLVVSDGAKGIESSLDQHLSGVPHQRCIFHKIKNRADHLQYLDLPPAPPEALHQAKQARKHAILADAGQIYATDVEAEIRARAAVFRTTWEAREPKAVANFFTDFELTLSYLGLAFPRTFVSLIRTTNLLERFHKEIWCKQRDIVMFQSERGCDALWYLIATRETAKQRAARLGRH